MSMQVAGTNFRVKANVDGTVHVLHAHRPLPHTGHAMEITKALTLARDPPPLVSAVPQQDNMYIFHYVLRGPPDTAYDGGYYYGTVEFPSNYPMGPRTMKCLPKRAVTWTVHMQREPKALQKGPALRMAARATASLQSCSRRPTRRRNSGCRR
jgi:hypothetical protein